MFGFLKAIELKQSESKLIVCAANHWMNRDRRAQFADRFRIFLGIEIGLRCLQMHLQVRRRHLLRETRANQESACSRQTSNSSPMEHDRLGCPSDQLYRGGHRGKEYTRGQLGGPC